MLRGLFKSLTTKLVIQISSTVLIIYTIVLGYNYFESRKEISAYAEMHCKRVAESTANLILSKMDEAERAAIDSIPVLLPNWDDRQFIATLIEMIVSQNQELAGALLIMQESGPANNPRVIHLNRTPRGIERVDIDILSKGSSYLEIYESIIRGRDGFWSKPMLEPETENPVVVYAMPVRPPGGQGKALMGVILIEMSLMSIEQITTSTKVFNTGYSFIISQDGTIIAHPFSDLIARQTIFGLAKQFSNPSVAEIGMHMVRGESGFTIFNSIILKQSSFAYYVPIPEYGWSLAVLCAQSDMFQGMIKLSRSLLILAFSGFTVLFLLVVFISSRITRPLRSLSYAAKEIGKGNLDYEIPKTRSADEVGVLTNVFSDMSRSLKRHIDILTEATASRERISSELQIAHDVQMSILPGLDTIPENKNFRIHALMSPARQVGGDMYDFFMTDESSLWLIIGDVSGKGIPAAFYMALAKTMLHMAAISHSTPGEVLTVVNDEICKNNPYSMFITIFIARLNLKTGALLYSNAGHNPPVIIQKNSKLSYMDEKMGPACGMSQMSRYGTRRARLISGDILFMFTDGITESLNTKGELFTDERLHEVLAGLKASDPERLIGHVMRAVKGFSQGAPQNDDISMLAVQCTIPGTEPCSPKSRRINVKNDPANIDRINAFVSDFGRSCSLSDSTIGDLQLVIEELFINICRYAHDDGLAHDVHISLSFDGASVEFTIEDDGRFFDPLEFTPKTDAGSIDELQIGGQGIRIVRSLTDSLSHQFVNGRNILTGRKRI